MNEKIRMYPTESCLQQNGRYYLRVPTKEEALAFFAHPASELNADHLEYWSAMQGRAFARKTVTAEEIATIHPDHAGVISPLKGRIQKAQREANMKAGLGYWIKGDPLMFKLPGATP